MSSHEEPDEPKDEPENCSWYFQALGKIVNHNPVNAVVA